jgi:hypothetical protein
MMIISVLAIIGLIGLFTGLWAFFYVNRFIKSEDAPLKWKKLRRYVLIIGLLIGVLSWPGTFFLGYPISSGTETIRVVGIPFIAAYFDSAGRDYISPLMLLGVTGNGIFWFLVPHIFLAIYLRQRGEQRNANNHLAIRDSK